MRSGNQRQRHNQGTLTIDGEIKTFQDEIKFKQYLFLNPALQKTLEGEFQSEEVNQTQRKHKE